MRREANPLRPHPQRTRSLSSTHLRAPPGDDSELGGPHEPLVRGEGQADGLGVRREFGGLGVVQQRQVRADPVDACRRVAHASLHADALLASLL